MLNEVDCRACQLCGGERHDDVGVDVDVTREPVRQHVDAVAPSHVPLSPAESKHSETSKRNAMDPPAAVDATGASNGENKPITRRGSAKIAKRRSSRRARLTNHAKDDEKNRVTRNKHDSTTSSATVAEPAAAAALSSLHGAIPLPGEGTTQAIAQLLGLNRHNNLNTTDTSTADHSKHSRSEAGSSANPKSNKSQTTAEKSDHTDSHHHHGGKVKEKRKTTFSDNLQDIHNANKLNNKIQGDRDHVDKKKAVKRGDRGEHRPKQHGRETQGNEHGKKELRAGAKPWVPPSGNIKDNGEPRRTSDFKTKKLDGNKTDKSKKNKNSEQKSDIISEVKKDGEPQAPSSSYQEATHHLNRKDTRTSYNEKNAGQNTKKLKNKQLQQHTGVNLTLQAIQQKKQQSQRPPPKQYENMTEEGSTGEKPIGEEEKKAPSKQNNSAERHTNPATKHSFKKSDNSATQENTASKASVSATHAPSSVLNPAIPPNQPQTTNDLNYAAGRPILVVHIAEKPSIAQVGTALSSVVHAK